MNAVESTYREQSARILAVLVRLFGPGNLQLAEDVMQEAFRKALVAWQAEGVPENPAAWIIATAKHQAIDVIRGQRNQRRFSSELADYLESGWTLSYTVEREFEETRIRDDQLRMIFMCTSADLPPENRLPLILRTLCGLSIPAIGRALLLPEATVKKRLLRTRERLKGHAFEFPATDRLPDMMDTVHTVIYLLFNEGFHSSDEAASPMTLGLCEEAVHLANLLASEPRVVNGDTLGLLALMHFHLARTLARLDSAGRSIHIDRQDRARWDAARIADARQLLRLVNGVTPGASGRFLVEAQIAEQHCVAASFVETDWPAIVRLYDQLVATTGSPLAGLHRAVALGYTGAAQAAIAEVEQLQNSELLRRSHLPAAVLAHLFALLGDADAARAHARASQRQGGTAREQRALTEQVERLLAARSAPA